MKIWKPLTKYNKQRKEWAYHCDFSLEEGELFELKLPNGESIKETCPEDMTYKFHFEICIEPFKKE